MPGVLLARVETPSVIVGNRAVLFADETVGEGCGPAIQFVSPGERSHQLVCIQVQWAGHARAGGPQVVGTTSHSCERIAALAAK